MIIQTYCHKYDIKWHKYIVLVVSSIQEIKIQTSRVTLMQSCYKYNGKTTDSLHNKNQVEYYVPLVGDILF